MIETTTSSKLARTCVEASEPVVLTARSWLRARADLAHALRNAQFDLRFVADWDRMPEAVERIAADIVLVDLDAAEATSRTTRGPSGYRLVSVLARQIAGQATALVVMTGLDFVEIEELARAGITALVSPRLAPKALAAQLYAALARARHKLTGRSVQPRGTLAAEPEPEPSGQAGQPERAEPPAVAANTAQCVDDGWRMPDTLWGAVQALLPRPSRRARISDRHVMDGLLLLARTGAAATALPHDFGSAATLRRRQRSWQEAGVFARLAAVVGEAQPGLRWERLAGLLTRRSMAPVLSRVSA
jgi:transposase